MTEASERYWEARWRDEHCQVVTLEARIVELHDALGEAKYFFDDDFPDGADGPCAVTERYRAAYKKILAALGANQKRPAPGEPEGGPESHK